jgi:hypothetical protein
MPVASVPERHAPTTTTALNGRRNYADKSPKRHHSDPGGEVRRRLVPPNWSAGITSRGAKPMRRGRSHYSVNSSRTMSQVDIDGVPEAPGQNGHNPAKLTRLKQRHQPRIVS